MFNRKKIKQEAKTNLLRHYLKNIFIVFICTLIISGTYIYKTETNIKKNISPKEIVTKSDNKTVYDIIMETVTQKPKNKNPNKKEKIQNGILAPIVNDMTENNSIIFSFVNTLNKGFFGGKVNEVIVMFICSIVALFITVFIRQVFIVGKNRYYLEQRRYDTKMDKIFFPFKMRNMKHIAYILFFKMIYQMLWFLTIIGGIIKHYEYSMIPYILAENPTISKKDAFRLSKEMTYNHKFDLFKVDLSMIGWNLIGIITFGLSNILFTDGYTECINAEIYMNLRNKAKFKKDQYLDIPNYKNEEYPEEKYLIKTSSRKWLKLNYNQDYDIQTYILFFFTFAFIGWLWEISLGLITTGHFTNRGTMFGPWLPIYGFGIVFILILLKPLRKEPLKLFIATLLLCGTLEYTTSWILEIFFHMKWWDYTGYFLNLNGRICLEGLLLFGFGGCTITYMVAPLLNNLFVKINPKTKKTICIILLSLFISDLIYSIIHPNIGEGITDEIQK